MHALDFSHGSGKYGFCLVLAKPAPAQCLARFLDLEDFSTAVGHDDY